MKVKFCPKCNKEYDNKLAFCKICGTKLEEKDKIDESVKSEGTKEPKVPDLVHFVVGLLLVMFVFLFLYVVVPILQLLTHTNLHHNLQKRLWNNQYINLI